MAGRQHNQRKMKKLEAGGSGDDALTTDQRIQKVLEEIEALNDQEGSTLAKIDRWYKVLRDALTLKRNKLIEKIPHIWITAFVNHPDLSLLLRDFEEDCLHHMVKIQVEEYEDAKAGYKLHFFFEENPYFENQVLTKDYHLAALNGPKSESIKIDWKQGFEVMQPKEIDREQKSFLMWYHDHSNPDDDKIGEDIKYNLCINPAQYFLGKNPEEDKDDEEESPEKDKEEEGGEGEASNATAEAQTSIEKEESDSSPLLT